MTGTHLEEVTIDALPKIIVSSCQPFITQQGFTNRLSKIIMLLSG